MTDPTTPTPPVSAKSAKSARETIAEALDSLTTVVERHTSADPGSDDECWSYTCCGAPTVPGLHLDDCDAAHALRSLRALLDAPPNAVERLCEAAAGALAMLRDRTGKVTINTEPLERALAAVRASPEAVGAGASEEVNGFRYPETVARVNAALEAERAKTAEAVRERDSYKAHMADEARKHLATMAERDALKARLDVLATGYGGSLATAEERVAYCERGREALKTVIEEVKAERDALKAELAAVWAFNALVRATLGATEEQSLNDAAQYVVDEGERAKADLAAARGKAERLEVVHKHAIDVVNAAREADSDLFDVSCWETPAAQRYARGLIRLDTALNDFEGTREPVTPPPTPAYAAADLTQIARMDRIEARVATIEKAAPPPASEAPISERARHDPVDHPAHYCGHPSGVECIQITEHLPFCVGNAIKYLWRHDAKNGVEDLKKARWYVSREIERREILAAAERAVKGEGANAHNDR